MGDMGGASCALTESFLGALALQVAMTSQISWGLMALSGT